MDINWIFNHVLFFPSVSINYHKMDPNSAFTEFWSEIIVLISFPGLILSVFNQQLHEMSATYSVTTFFVAWIKIANLSFRESFLQNWFSSWITIVQFQKIIIHIPPQEVFLAWIPHLSGNSSLASHFPLKVCFRTLPPPWKVFYLPWGGYGYFLELQIIIIL